MAIVNPNTVSTSTIALSNSEILVIGEGALLATTNTAVTTNTIGSVNEMFVLGAVFSDNGFGVSNGQSSSVELVVGTRGNIYSGGNSAVDFAATSSITVQNHGLVSTTVSNGLRLTGTGADPNTLVSLINTGTIAGVFNGLLTSSGSQSTTIDNSGTITASGGNAINMSASTGTLSIANSGTIQSSFQFGSGIQFLGTTMVTNSGEILAAGSAIEGIGSLTVVNTGQIIGGDGLALSAQSGSLDNAGEIRGAVDLTGLATVRNSGEINGNVSLAFGSVRNTGEIFGTVQIGSGTDSLRNFGLIEDDVLLSSGDSILRNAGSIGGRVALGDGNDTYAGAGGQVSEEIDGGNGDDTLKGGAFDDILLGGNGADVLMGRGGDDWLEGGSGIDVLTGGNGADAFVFTSVSQSGKGAKADTITDFVRGTDVIDLAGFTEDLTFIGTAAFSGSAGEVRVRSFQNGRFVQIDIDGDGKFDMEIRVLGVTALSATDFVL